MNPAPPGAPVAVAFQGVHSGGTQLDVFFIGNDGGLYVGWIVDPGAWNAPVRITPPHMAPAGAAVAAAGRGLIPLGVYPDGDAGTDAVGYTARLDVFFIGHDGALYVTSAIGLEAWMHPERIGDFSLAPPGANVAAARQRSNQLDVFFIGRDGGLYVAWVIDGEEAWQGPLRVSPEGVAPPGAGLIATQQAPNLLSVLFVGHDGGLHVSWVVGTGAWEGPVGISPAGIAPPGARLAFGKQTREQLDVFFIGNDGKLYVSWVVGGGNWAGPVGISPPNVAPPGAGLVASWQTADQLDVFFVGNDGALNVSWVVGTGVWAGPVAITRPGHAPPGTQPAAAFQTTTQLDVFVNGPERWVSWAEGGAAWDGPYAMPN
ncbi:hypothetical protein [Micromonospora sp. IBSANI012]|uniref:hypothetical protein n=1 Tax=Micromonospora sp. IBSANI012 TaxID=3457761 RepID=UPI00405A0512